MKLNFFKSFKCFDPSAAVAPVAAPAAAPAAAPVAAPAAPVSPAAPGSASISMPLPGATPADKAVQDFTNMIPQDVRDRPYMKDVDSIDKLLAKLDGAQKLIGTRPAGIPAADAPPEEWNKFYDALGRPKTAAEYTFEDAGTPDPKFTDAVRGAMHKHGLTPTQAKGIYSDVNTALQAIAKEKGIAEEKLNTDFDALGAKLFGAERDKVLSSTKVLLDKFTPAEMKPHVANLSNEQLMVLTSVVNNIAKTYIKEDGQPGGGPASSTTPDSIRAEARSLMAQPAYADPFHPDHGKVKGQVDALYAQLKK